MVTIFGQDDDEWAILCSILGIDELLKDPRYDTHEKRLERKFELYLILDVAFRQKTRAEWEKAFRESGLRCDSCLDYAELVSHPQFQSNDILVEVEHPRDGRLTLIGSPVKFKNECSAMPERPPPILGEHTKELLLEIGYRGEEILKLHEEGVIGMPTAEMLATRPWQRVFPAPIRASNQRREE